MKKSRFWVNLSIVVAMLTLLAIVVFQIYNYFFLAVKTEYAVEASMQDTYEINGIICRDEKILKDKTAGYHDIILTDGEKVARGGIIAYIYGNEADVKAQEQIRLLNAEIESYNAAISSKASYAGDNSSYDQSIQNALLDYSGALHSNNTFDALEALSNFEKRAFIKEIVTGSEVNYQEEIEHLRRKINNLESSISGNVNKMVSDCAGYYSRAVDGYEEIISPDAMLEFDIKKYNDLLTEINSASNSVSDNVGKIVSGYHWDYYFVVPTETIKNYKVGQSMYFRFPSVSEDRIKGEITSIKKEGDNALVSVECSAVHSEFLSLRTLEGFIITKTYSGIRVDKNSVRLLDGQSGVYVKVGQIVRFKKADVLYMGSSYALLDPNSKVSNFDEVIVSGKNLYDGKALP